jgi:hypothetical protein
MYFYRTDNNVTEIILCFGIGLDNAFNKASIYR